MSGFDTFLQKKKDNNQTLFTIEKLENNLKNQNTNIDLIRLQLGTLKEDIKEENSRNERRFGELYAYMHKLESAYYNGLRIPRPSINTTNEKPVLDNLIGNSNDSSGELSMEELFINK
tara:strand:- start:744 stop:1097 length:354 start_codon:yes stop_codon:yes gene_type:complete